MTGRQKTTPGRFCGIDFGTSNSTVAVWRGNEIVLAPLEGEQLTMPSAVFFSFAEGPLFGRHAIQDYTDGEPGRLMRALKSILGYGLFHEKTRLQKQFLALSDVLALYVERLKSTAEAFAGVPLEQVVMGRPVQFIEHDAEADRRAQNDLEEAVRKLGFRDVAFQFEPIAAALEYEQSVSAEELILVVDIGGGTADFSIVRVSPDRARVTDRSADILANRGIRVGGTDFDRMISLRYAMPHFGQGSVYGAKKLDLPQALFFDLSTWSRINFLYSKESIAMVRGLLPESSDRPKIQRLLGVLERHDGHRLVDKVERAKIALTHEKNAVIDLDEIVSGLRIPISEAQLTSAVAPGVARIGQAITETMKDAGVSAADIDTVFLTGGSSLMPAVRNAVAKLLGRSDLATGDMFGAVGKGLGLDAQRRFG